MYLEFQSAEARKFNRDGKILQQLNPSLFSSFVIIGDFNVNFCNTSHPLHNALTDVLNSFNLTQVVGEHTHVTSHGNASMIDLALLANPEQQLVDCDTIPPLANSDHNGISLTLKISGTTQEKHPKPAQCSI